MIEIRWLTPESEKLPSRRPCLLVVLDHLADWPDELPLNGRRFSLLLAMDGREVGDDGLREWNAFVDRATSQGLAYFSAWGPDCERIHDLMDQALTARELDREVERRFTMTTWHEDEDIEEVLEFFCWCAFDFELQESDAPGVIALVGRPELVDRVVRSEFT